jgi:hypothetical protein
VQKKKKKKKKKKKEIQCHVITLNLFFFVFDERRLSRVTAKPKTLIFLSKKLIIRFVLYCLLIAQPPWL